MARLFRIGYGLAARNVRSARMQVGRALRRERRGEMLGLTEGRPQRRPPVSRYPSGTDRRPPGERAYVGPTTVRSTPSLTKKQFRRLLERNVAKERVGAQGQPTTETPYARLYPMTMAGDFPVRSGGPIDVRRDLATGMVRRGQIGKGPMFESPAEYVPPANVLSMGGAQPTYERRVFRPVGEKVTRAVTGAKAVAEEQARTQATRQADLVKRGRRMAKSIKAATGEVMPSEELVKTAESLDTMWKVMVKGKHTLLGKYWDRLRAGSRSRRKVADTWDYFIRMGLRWLEDPDKTRRMFPREVDSLESIWNEYRSMM